MTSNHGDLLTAVGVLGRSRAPSFLVVPEQRQQNDDRDGHAQDPKQYTSTKAHVRLRLVGIISPI